MEQRSINQGLEPPLRLEINQFWERVATSLNSMEEGQIRTSNKWRDYWYAKKSGVKYKAAYRDKNDGKKTVRWTQMDQRILNLKNYGTVYTVNLEANPLSTPISNASDESSVPEQQVSDNEQEGVELPAHKLVTDAQLERLVEIIGQEPIPRVRVNQYWERVAKSLNSMGEGQIRTGNKWKEYWQTKKCRVKNKAAYRDKNDGEKTVTWTPMDQRILNLTNYGTVYTVNLKADPFSTPNSNASDESSVPEQQASDNEQEQQASDNEQDGVEPDDTESEANALLVPLVEMKRQRLQVAEQQLALEKQRLVLLKRQKSQEKMSPATKQLHIFLEKRRLGLEERRLAQDEQKFALEEKRMALEERRIDLEDRKLALEEKRVALEEKRLEWEEQRIYKRQKIVILKNEPRHIHMDSCDDSS